MGIGYTLPGYVLGRSFARIVSDLGIASLVAVSVVSLALTACVVRCRRARKRGPGSRNADTPGAASLRSDWKQ